MDWFPPSSASPPFDSAVPAGFVICDGRLWTSVNTALGATNDLGYTSGNVPDLIGKTTLGAVNTANSIGQIGTHNSSSGAQQNPGVGGTVGQNTNSVSGHSHTIQSHTHGMDHYHFGGIPVKTNFYANISSSNQGAYAVNGTIVGTGGALIANTYDARPNTDGSGVLNTSSTSTVFLENRPAGVGVLKIMKVKNL